MVDTIGVAVRDAGARERRRALTLHLAGLVTGALVVGLTLALVAAAVRPAGLAESPVLRTGLVLLGVGWAVSAFGRRGLPFPRRRWQVPERWRFMMPFETTVLFYGALLGVGFLTDVVFPVFWMFVLLCVFFGSPGLVAAAWLLYALARFGVMTLWLSDAPDDSLTSRFVGWRPVAAAANGVLLLAISASTLATF